MSAKRKKMKAALVKRRRLWADVNKFGNPAEWHGRPLIWFAKWQAKRGVLFDDERAVEVALTMVNLNARVAREKSLAKAGAKS